MVRICCLSDLHGHLPEVPPCDLLLLGGDYCRNHKDHFWYRDEFGKWIDELSTRMKIVGVAGNHDYIFERNKDMVPKMNWDYLEDSGIEWKGLNIWGSPWQPRFWDWAFNADEPELARIWAKIPDDTDILVLHGPPRGYGDFSPYGRVHTGSPSLLQRIEEIKPKLVIAGHIHSGYGRYMIGDTIFVNASYVNEQYEPANELIVVDLPELAMNCHWASYPDRKHRKHEKCWGKVERYDEQHTESQAVYYYTCQGHKAVDNGGEYVPKQ